MFELFTCLSSSTHVLPLSAIQVYQKGFAHFIIAITLLWHYLFEKKITNCYKYTSKSIVVFSPLIQLTVYLFFPYQLGHITFQNWSTAQIWRPLSPSIHCWHAAYGVVMGYTRPIIIFIHYKCQFCHQTKFAVRLGNLFSPTLDIFLVMLNCISTFESPVMDMTSHACNHDGVYKYLENC